MEIVYILKDADGKITMDKEDFERLLEKVYNDALATWPTTTTPWQITSEATKVSEDEYKSEWR